MSDLVDRHDMAAAVTQLQEQRAAAQHVREAEAPEAAPEERPSRPRRPERVEPEEDEGEDLHFANDDEAYEYLQDRRDAHAQDEADDDPAHSPAASRQADNAGDSDTSGTSAEPGLLWSTADLETMIGLQQAEQAFRADFAAYAQLKSRIDLNAIERQDRGKAAAIRAQLGAIEADLRQSYAAINAEAGKLHGKVQQHNSAQAQKKLDAEERKLQRLAPDLDKKAVATYLVGSAGFSRQEVESVKDARLVALADDARRWREHEASQKASPKKIPRLRKGAKGRTSAPARSPDAVSAARAKLEKSGTVDDALQYVTELRRNKMAAW